MNTTPIDSLFSRQSGKFLSDDELSQIQHDLTFLIQENKKLSALLDQKKIESPSQPTHPQPTHPQPTHPQPTHPQPTHPQPTHPQPTHPQPTHPQPTHPQPTHPQPTHPQPTHPQPTHPQPSQILHATPEKENSYSIDGRTITIIIDTNKLVYLLLFIIIMIIILKK
jgi:hypothetical protein